MIYLKQMKYNILPRCNTLQHYFPFIDITTVSHWLGEAKLSPLPQYMPIIRNFDGKTVLDIAIENQQYNLIELIFANLKKSPYNHHSRLIYHQIPQAIKMDIKGIGSYLDSRILKTTYSQQISKGFLKGNENELISKGYLWSNKV